MTDLKPYVKIPCEYTQDISKGIFDYLSNNTTLLDTKEYGWHFVNTKELLAAVPPLLEFFKQHKLIPRDSAITIITEDSHLPVHIDEPPVIAKINIPVLNTTGWANRWYDSDTKQLIAEVVDLSCPIAFNSQIPHSVEKTTATEVPRVIASFTFHNEPLDLLR